MIFQTAIDAVTQIVNDIIGFFPRLVNGVIILIVGILLARLVRWALQTALTKGNVDGLLDRVGVGEALRGVGVRTPVSRILSQTIFLMLLLSFLITATREMGLAAVARILETISELFPNLIGAAIVFIIGGIAARYLGDMVGTMVSGAGLDYGARLGGMVRGLVTAFVAILALGVLGMDTAILVTALTMFIAAFALAIGIALGLGARGIVLHVLAGYYIRNRFPSGERVTVQNVDGEIADVGSVNTRITTATGAMIVPNATLLESTVETHQA